jgi:hypothetical protein
MLLDSTFGKAWSRDEFRENRFVVIGRNIDASKMREGLQNCIYQPSEIQSLLSLKEHENEEA